MKMFKDIHLTQYSKISTLGIIKGHCELEITNLSNFEDLSIWLTNEEAATLHNKLAIYLKSLVKKIEVTCNICGEITQGLEKCMCERVCSLEGCDTERVNVLFGIDLCDFHYDLFRNVLIEVK